MASIYRPIAGQILIINSGRIIKIYLTIIIVHVYKFGNIQFITVRYNYGIMERIVDHPFIRCEGLDGAFRALFVDSLEIDPYP